MKKLTITLLSILMIVTMMFGTVACTSTEETKYQITYTTDGNGTIQGSTSQTVLQGKDGTTVTAIPNNGYEFLKWSDNNSTNPIRTDRNVTKDITAKATFKVVEPTEPNDDDKVNEIKRINNGAYEAYFKNANNSQSGIARTASESGHSNEWFETWFKVISGVVAAIVEEKQTDVLSKSYTFLEAANIASGITAVFTERGIEANFITQISEELVPMSFTIHGTVDNTLYVSAVDVNTGFVMNVSITYNGEEDYALTYCYPRGGEFIDRSKDAEHFDSSSKEWYSVYYGTYQWPGHDGLEWSDDSSNPATTYEEAKAKVDEHITNFDNAVATFPAKESALLIFD